MNSAAENQTCPGCGAAIPANAPQGICPKCLMAAAATTTDAGQTRGRRPEPPSLERLAAAFPQLELAEFIGQGGMGAVYKARQKQLDRIVALKVLPPGIGGDAAFAERFTREAKALAKLLHPNIVALFEFGQADGIYYLLMEYVDGVNLGQLLRSSRVSPREALAIVPQICDALQYAHDQGIVHRDIKPENILLDRRGRVKVADFGLAKLVEANGPLSPTLSPSEGERGTGRPGEGKTPALTDAGKVMGTPAYMAPEQVEHPGEVDHRADIYALGVVFYQMLTGELPGKAIEPPSKKVQVDVRLDEVVLRALEKKPELRYQQVSEVKTMVETIVATPSAGSRREEAQNESGKASGGLVTTMVKSERARLAVQESPRAKLNYPAMGEVALYTDRLVISSGSTQRSIPLADIHELGEAVMPFWVSPGPHFFAAVDFDEAGQRRRLVFLAGSSIIRSPRDTRLHAAEWLTAIQRAIKSGIGRDVSIAPGPTVVPVRTWRSRIWLLMPLAAAIPLIANLLTARGPGSLSDLMYAAQLSAMFVVMAVLTLFTAYVVRSCLTRGTVKRPLSRATGSVGGPPGSAPNQPAYQPPGATLAGAREAGGPPEAPFSRMAIVGACFGIPGILASVVYAVIGDSNLLDGGPSNVLAAFVVLCALISTILGWGAVAQIRCSTGKLQGMWLAMSDGLLFPLLALDGLLAFQASAIVQTFSTIDAVVARLGIQPASGEWFKWLAAIATVFVCVVLNTLITWGVWRAVNKRSAGGPPADPENSTFGKWARGPLLVAALGPSLLMTVVPWQEGLAEGLTAAIGSVAQALALVWGLINWRQRSGKGVVIATSILFVALIVAAAVLSFAIVPAKLARLQAAFGPVTERTLPMGEDGWTPLFDLDYNRLVPDPKPGDISANMAQHLAQLKKPGVAIYHDGQIQVITVSGMTMHCTDGDGDQWERITDMETLEAFLSAGVTAPGSWQTADFPGKLPVTIFFKTGAGKLGLLRVTALTENPRGVKIRYKLVQDPNANVPTAESSAPAAGRPEATFGPVIERTADLSEPERDLFLSFETGKLMTEPGGRLNTPEPEKLRVTDEALAWARSAGADVLIRFCVGKTGPGSSIGVPQLNLESLDMAMFPTNTEAWDELSSQAVAAAVRSAPEHNWWQGLAWGGADYTFLFRTRQGKAGILQITGFTGNPRGVKIRYKLVRDPNANVPTAESSAPVAGGPEAAFGPVIDTTIDMAKLGGFDLDNGRFNEVSVEEMMSEPTHTRWSQLHGNDLILLKPDGRNTAQLSGLLFVDMKPTEVDKSFWRKSASELLNDPSFSSMLKATEEQESAGNAKIWWRESRKPRNEADTPTYLFKTREGGMGILQITGFTGNPRGVKIRYKLVLAERNEGK